jgi:hypothetical protein
LSEAAVERLLFAESDPGAAKSFGVKVPRNFPVQEPPPTAIFLKWNIWVALIALALNENGWVWSRWLI